MDSIELATDFNAVDKEILKRLRIVLHACIEGSKTDLDIIAIRLLNVLKEEVNVNIYKDILMLGEK